MSRMAKGEVAPHGGHQGQHQGGHHEGIHQHSPLHMRMPHPPHCPPVAPLHCSPALRFCALNNPCDVQLGMRFTMWRSNQVAFEISRAGSSTMQLRNVTQ